MISLDVNADFIIESGGHEFLPRVIAQRVSVLNGNHEAIRFYEHLGFKCRVQELMMPVSDQPAQESGAPPFGP